MNLVQELETQLNLELTKLIEVEEQLEVYEQLKSSSKQTIKRLKIAYDALSGTDTEVAPAPAARAHPEVRGEAVEVIPERPVQAFAQNDGAGGHLQPPAPRIHCNACGGSMEHGYRELSNGRTVNLLVCKDSGCNNEQLA